MKIEHFTFTMISFCHLTTHLKQYTQISLFVCLWQMGNVHISSVISWRMSVNLQLLIENPSVDSIAFHKTHIDFHPYALRPSVVCCDSVSLCLTKNYLIHWRTMSLTSYVVTVTHDRCGVTACIVSLLCVFVGLSTCLSVFLVCIKAQLVQVRPPYSRR